MKKNVFFSTITVMVIFLLSIGSAIGQSNESPDIQAKNQQVVLGVPKISAKTLPLFTDALEKMTGAEYVMFCPKDKLLIIEYDLKIFPNEETIIRALRKHSIQLQMFIKEAIIEDIIELCQQETTY